MYRRQMPRCDANGDLCSASHFQHSGQGSRAFFLQDKEQFLLVGYFFSESMFMALQKSAHLGQLLCIGPGMS